MVKYGETWWNMVKYDVYPILIPHSNLIIYSVSKKKYQYLPTGAGFCPSTVAEACNMLKYDGINSCEDADV